MTSEGRVKGGESTGARTAVAEESKRAPARDPGSFRDPSGHVYDVEGGIYRTVTDHAARDYEFLRESKLLDELQKKEWVVATEEVEPRVLGPLAGTARHVLKHHRIPYLSYPYEWSFSGLKAAALRHLEVHTAALSRGVTLSDSSAYNIQFLGPNPVFIDVLSFRRYEDGEFWAGHRQFCEQFLNPLLLQSIIGIPFNGWYRGTLEGIETSELARLIPFHRRFSPGLLSNVIIPAGLQSKARGATTEKLQSVQKRKLPLHALVYMLDQLRKWIQGLEPRGAESTTWRHYVDSHLYSDSEVEVKRKFVAEYVATSKPRRLFDIGCNTGDYSELALQSGAREVVGFDLDPGAVNAAFMRARERKLGFLPLVVDLANPSPSQGWNEMERRGFHTRGRADGLVALALIHHLAIGRNIPLEEVVDCLVKLAPSGVIEFIPKGDPNVVKMLALRRDVFHGYGEESFVTALKQRARLVREMTIGAGGRKLFWYERERNAQDSNGEPAAQ